MSFDEKKKQLLQKCQGYADDSLTNKHKDAASAWLYCKNVTHYCTSVGDIIAVTSNVTRRHMRFSSMIKPDITEETRQYYSERATVLEQFVEMLVLAFKEEK